MTAETIQGFRLSPQQRRLWRLQRDEDRAYAAGCALLLEGALEPTALGEALRGLVVRHEILRTEFRVLDGMKVPVQVLGPPEPGLRELPKRELKDVPEKGLAAFLSERLGSSPPEENGLGALGAELLALSPDRHALLLRLPALCMDERGLVLLARELMEDYERALAGEGAEGRDEPMQYADLAEWQNQLLEEDDTAAGKEYWRRRRAVATPEVGLPFERSGEAAGRGGRGTCRRSLPPELCFSLEGLARGAGVGVEAVLLGAFMILLRRLGGGAGVPVARAADGRRYEELGHALGLLTRHLPLRVDVAPDRPVRDFLSAVHSEIEETERWQEYYEGPEAEGGGIAALRFGFSFTDLPEVVGGKGLRWRLLDHFAEVDRFELSLSCRWGRDGALLKLQFPEDRLEVAGVDRFGMQLETLLSRLPGSLDVDLDRLDFSSDAERHWMLFELNRTAVDLPADTDVLRLFDRQVAEAPERVALVAPDGCLTYRTLDRRAEAVRERLAALRLAPEAPVAVLLDRSPSMVAALLGVLKAGAGFVPLDPHYPQDRLHFMLEDSGARALLSEPHLAPHLSSAGVPRVDVPEPGAKPAPRPPDAPDSSRLAYVIYTSGSTGRPKGVMIPHGGLRNHLLWVQAAYGLQPDDRVLHKTPISFDVAVREIFWPLSAGAQVVLARPGGHRDAEYLLETTQRERVSVLNLVPSQLSALLELDGADALGTLRRVIAGGEALPAGTAQRVVETLEARLHNHYGPTETTIAATYATCGPGEPGPVVSIGRPVGNAQVYVTGRRLWPAAAGEAGELCIGGAGLARGYLDRPGLTAAAFVPDAWSSDPGGRLYRSGDLGRLRTDGTVEFLGRIDQQVKVRGFRIELGEIEAALLRHPQVARAVVAVQREAARGEMLVGYLVARGGSAPSSSELTDLLRGELPEFMVPAAFVFLEELPLTPSGKVDRGALPAPDPASVEPDAAIVAPRTPVEELLAEIWREVLGIERLGVHEGFFELGGHSLLATRLIARTRELFRVELPLRTIFDRPTIARLAETIQEVSAAGEGPQRPPLEPVPRTGDLPLAMAQERLWFLHKLDPSSAAYHMARSVHLRGSLDVAALGSTLVSMSRRHEVLRTVFVEVDGRAVQRILPTSPARALSVVDLQTLAPARRERELDRIGLYGLRRPFDLATGPLLRLMLLRLEPRDHLAFFSMHHIISDGWSMSVLVREVAALYTAAATSGKADLPELPIQYADYACWQRSWLRGEVLEAELDYWRERLKGAPPELRLPTDRPRPPVFTYRGRDTRFGVSAAVSDGMRSVARRCGATLFMALLAAFKVLLYRYSGEDDLLVGTPVAGRDRTETNDLIGFLINTLVIRSDLSRSPSFPELVGRVRDSVLEAHAHQEVPFERLVEEMTPRRSLSYTPLFQVMFVLQNIQWKRLELPGLDVEEMDQGLGTSRFDLTMGASDGAEGIRGVLQYCSDIFDASTVERMLGHWKRLLEAIAADPDRPIDTLDLMSSAEAHQVLREWGGGAGVQPARATLPGRFELQVARAPDRVALVAAEGILSYGELSRRSDLLASRMRRFGVRAGTTVALYLEREPAMMESILAVLKLGAAYLPLDVVHPADRISFMAEDAGAQVILTDSTLADRLPETAATVLRVEDTGGPAEPLSPAAEADGTAYVIYTSGSTGRPKGVLVSHSNAVALLDATEPLFRFGADDTWTLFHSYAFDFSVWEIWASLLYGGRLVLIPFALSRSPRDFYELLGRERVTVLNQTPSAFHQLSGVDAAAGARGARDLRLVIFGGEALELRSLEPWFRRRGDRIPRLVNMYGITETTVHVTARWLTMADASGPIESSIGFPLPHLAAFVVDRRGRPTPSGVPGEVQVGGAGVSRGYLKRPGLTAERFVPDALSGATGARLYRTGDLARHVAGAGLEYLGRIDHQVKVRGFRIELGEIEAVLGSHSRVARCVVTAREDRTGSARLVAYFVPGDTPPPVAAELRRHVAGALPEYMVPASFVVLDELPLTPNGKVDRRALPEPAGDRPDLESSYVAPRTFSEDVLASIWARVLGVERIGVHDNFFALGGDSIRTIQVAALAKERSIPLSLQDLFQHQTIADLTRAGVTISSLAGKTTSSREPFALLSLRERESLPEDVEDAYPLTRLQAGMLYHGELSRDYPLYHNVESWTQHIRFDRHAFEAAVAGAVVRHPVLRTSFDMTSHGRPLQRVHREARVPIVVDDLTHLSPRSQEEALARFVAEEKRRIFDLLQPPLLRLHVHRLGEETFQFTITECHAILDGWSLGSLVAEIASDYGRFLADEPAGTTAPSSATFRDFVELELAALESDEHERYWSRVLSGCTIPELPGLHATREARHPVLERIPVSDEAFAALRRLSSELAVPLKSLCLAVHLRVLGAFTGQQDILTGVVTHGRPDELGADRILGLFLNTVPFRMQLQNGSWADLARRVFDAERELLPFRRYPLAALQKRWGTRPLIETVFNFTYFHVMETGFQSRGMRAESAGDRRMHWSLEENHFALTTTFNVSSDGSRMRLLLQSRLGRSRTRSLTRYYLQALERMVAAPESWFGSVDLLPASARHQVVHEWNDTAAPRDPGTSIHGPVEEWAARAPDAVAAVCGDQLLTYGELERQANRLARLLLDLGIGAGDLVGVHLRRSLSMLPALLGVLKSGGAYVPLEPAWPRERARWILTHLGSRCVVTDGTGFAEIEELASELPFLDHLICLEGSPNSGGGGPSAWGPEALGRFRAERPGVPVDGGSLAYVIFTSGSTGRPKGVAVLHAPVANLVEWVNRRFGVGPQDRVLFVTSLTFDLSVYDVFGVLAAGGCVHVASDDELGEPRRLVDLLAERPVTFWDSAPAALQQLTAFFPELGEGTISRGLDLVFLSGDWIPVDLPDRIRERFPDARVVGLGGATEATVWSNAFPVREVGEDWTSIPYGRPIRNARYTILDPWLHPSPIGVTGDLYIGGECLALGYLGEPSKTAERFLPDPFDDRGGGRLYRTGDLARFFDDGNIEFLGRQDFQVKVRGYRVELGEIEAALAEHSAVADAVVAARGEPRGSKRLVAYVVPGAGAAPDFEALRKHLQDRLPEYMVPQAFVFLEQVPLTPNGKVDRGALPEPQDAAEEGPETADGGSSTPVEEILRDLWRLVLERDHARPDDDFFESGGDSLQATQLVARIRHAFGVSLELRTLFENPTLAAIARCIEQGLRSRHGVSELAIRRVDHDRPRPLSFAQQRLWFLDQLEPESVAYNVPTALWMRGTLELGPLAWAYNEVVRRHASLRTTFIERHGEPLQVIHPHQRSPLPVVDLSGLLGELREAAARRLAAAEAARPFDLAWGPLSRLVLLRLGDHEHVALATLHHIVSDGWSMTIFTQEITALYEAALTGRPSPLPELPFQYVDFAVWQREWLQGEVLDNLVAYWRRQLAGAPTEVPLVEGPRPAVSTRGGVYPFRLDGDRAAALKRLAREEGATLFMVLLAAFKTLLWRETAQKDLVVGTDLANRTRVETEGLIGFFLNLLPIRTELSGNPTFRNLVGRVRESSLGAYGHQDLPLDKMVEELRPERGLGHSPLFNVLFVFQNGAGTAVGSAGGGSGLGELRVDGFPVHHHTSKFDLSLFFHETDGGVNGTWAYKADLLDPERVSRISARFDALLGSLFREPDLRLDEIAITPEDDTREDAMDLKRHEEKSFRKFRRSRPRAVQVSQEELVRTTFLAPDETMPVVLEPASDEIDFLDWIEGNRDFLEEKVTRHGAILFRGFDLAEVRDFERAAGAVCPSLYGDYGDLPDEKEGEKVYKSTPYPSDKVIHFHNESSHTHQWPLRQFFFCVQPAEEGGRTPIVDCREVYRRLAPELRERFARQGLLYVRNFTEGLDVSWQQFFRTEDRAVVEERCREGGIELEWLENDGLRTRKRTLAVAEHPRTGERLFFNQILLHHVSRLDRTVYESLVSLFGEDGLPRNVYFGDGSPIPDDVVDQIEEVYWDVAKSFDWRKGDLLMVDNMLTAHARNPFSGARKIVVAMGDLLRQQDFHPEA